MTRDEVCSWTLLCVVCGESSLLEEYAQICEAVEPPSLFQVTHQALQAFVFVTPGSEIMGYSWLPFARDIISPFLPRAHSTLWPDQIHSDLQIHPLLSVTARF